MAIRALLGRTNQNLSYLTSKTVGAYLFIGLANKVSIGLNGVPFEEAEAPLAEHGIHLSVYEGEIKGGSWEGKLRPDILEKELLPFLREVYEAMGLFTTFGDAQDIIALLEQTPSEERYEQLLAAALPSFSDIGLLRITRLPIRQRHIGIRYSSIKLHSAGKIRMEEDGGMFDIFTIALQQQFEAFELAKALRVDFI